MACMQVTDGTDQATQPEKEVNKRKGRHVCDNSSHLQPPAVFSGDGSAPVHGDVLATVALPPADCSPQELFRRHKPQSEVQEYTIPPREQTTNPSGRLFSRREFTLAFAFLLFSPLHPPCPCQYVRVCHFQCSLFCGVVWLLVVGSPSGPSGLVVVREMTPQRRTDRNKPNLIKDPRENGVQCCSIAGCRCSSQALCSDLGSESHWI
jgi:hypothetical protein